VANHLGKSVKEHQMEIEQTYLENDLLFNPTHQRKEFDENE
jgi:hypothetical protein